jgi:hypothetical protein
MLSPYYRRELIRLGNRAGLNGTELASVIDFAEHMIALHGEPEGTVTAEDFLAVWMESFEDEP